VGQSLTKRQNILWPQLHDIHTIVFDFDGVFTDNKVYLNQDGAEWVCCDRADGLGMDFLRYARKIDSLRAEVFILSKEQNGVVTARAKKLQIPCFQGVGDKLVFIKNYLEERELKMTDPAKGLIYIGNDLNDLPVMDYAGFTVAPADAHILVKEIASIVLDITGGNGFVRAFIESLLRMEKMSLTEVREYVCNS